MGTVTGLTAARMLEIEAASVVDGDVVGDDLFLTKHDGSVINAGNVRGGVGPSGPMGSALAVVTAQQLLDVGQVGQIRAGRQLTPADFTAMGLSAPAGLWNLSNFNDSSGNARHLVNKGLVPLGVGINGLASTAAVFAGSTAQALYIADTGAADPFRLNNAFSGSIGAWMRCTKRGVTQYILTKLRTGGAGADYYYGLNINTANQAANVWRGGFATGTSDVCDDKWHFVVSTCDGTTTWLYVDGIMEGVGVAAWTAISSASPLNIGGYGADAATITSNPFYGMIDEVFVTGDVLTEEQQRNLYCASIPHALGVSPSVIRLAVRRKRRGSARAVTDYPSQPVRLYNFVNGALTDQGSNNVPLTNPGGFVTSPGAAGEPSGGYHFGGAGGVGLQATDTGLPSGLNPRSYEVWFKTKTITGNMWLMSWSTLETSLWMSLGTIRSFSGADSIVGPSVADGEWHQAVVVENNSASDGVKRKLYVDGRLAGGSTVMVSTSLQGANRFRIGSYSDGTLPFTGDISRVAIHAGAWTSEDIRKLYNVGSQVLAPSPKADSDHIEAIESGRLLASFDMLESNHLIDLAVMS